MGLHQLGHLKHCGVATIPSVSAHPLTLVRALNSGKALAVPINMFYP